MALSLTDAQKQALDVAFQRLLESEGVINGLPFSLSAALSSSGSSITLDTVGGSPNANAATIIDSVLKLQPADGSHPGVMTAGAQSIGGAKTFNSSVTSGGGFVSTFTSASVLGGTADFALNHVSNSAPSLANFGGALELGGITPNSPTEADIYLGSMQNRTTGSIVEFLNCYGGAGGAERSVYKFGASGDFSADGYLTLGMGRNDGRLQSDTGALYLESANGPLVLWNKGADNVADFYSTGGGSLVASVTASGKVLATGGVGVGNSAAATTPGAVVKKMEIFDANGASLGFIAIYNSIT